MMDLKKYRRLVADLETTGKKAYLQSDEDTDFLLRLCGVKMLEAAREFRALLQVLERQDDDGR